MLGARAGFFLDGVLHVAMGVGRAADRLGLRHRRRVGRLTSVSSGLGSRAVLWVGFAGFVVSLCGISPGTVTGPLPNQVQATRARRRRHRLRHRRVERGGLRPGRRRREPGLERGRHLPLLGCRGPGPRRRHRSRRGRGRGLQHLVGLDEGLPARPRPATKGGSSRWGRIGFIARGIAFALVGVPVPQRRLDPPVEGSTGLDGACASCRSAPRALRAERHRRRAHVLRRLPRDRGPPPAPLRGGLTPGGISPEPRTTRVGSITTCRGRLVSPSMRAKSRSATVLPMRCASWRITVSGGSSRSAGWKSSNPTSATSRRRPRSAGRERPL